jgi:hypothetical protein
VQQAASRRASARSILRPISLASLTAGGGLGDTNSESSSLPLLDDSVDRGHLPPAEPIAMFEQRLEKHTPERS